MGHNFSGVTLHRTAGSALDNNIGSIMSFRPAMFESASPHTIFVSLGYMACSSLMLVVNKLAVHLIPAPLMLLFAQLACTALVVRGASLVSDLDVESLKWSKVKAFLPASMIFLLTISLNMKTLQYANVETFIVFRASTPLALSVLEWVFLNRELPTRKSVISLAGLSTGSFFYVYSDSNFEVKGYAFVALWYLVFCVDQLYLRRIIDVVPMSSNWGRVYYSNILSCMPLPFLAYQQQEQAPAVWSTSAVFVFVLSLILGTSISYFAWATRSLLSATSFSVLGNICKVVSILINVTIWDKHATPLGLLCLSLCLGSALLYEQAPMKGGTAKAQTISAPPVSKPNLEDLEAAALLDDEESDYKEV